MTPPSGAGPDGGGISRRQLLAGSAGALGTAMAAVVADGAVAGAVTAPAGSAPPGGTAVPFFGPNQAGVVTPQQRYLVFSTFDAVSDRLGLADLLAGWSAAAARLAAGEPLRGAGGPGEPPADSGSALGLGPARLTLTFGYGPGLFDDRFGLAGSRPAALAHLPPLPGDALDPSISGGDLCVQACADDLQVAIHATTSLTQLAVGSAALRTVQTGFISGGDGSGSGESTETPRNLLGFKDGTANRAVIAPTGGHSAVWVGAGTDQRWMRNGTYLVARRIRVSLDAWSRTSLEDQEGTIGRHRASGAPLGGTGEFDVPSFAARGTDGSPLIPVDAHIRQGSPEANGGAQLLRRAYNYVDGIDPLTGQVDSGLYFICFQRDPGRQFVPIQRRLATGDRLTANYLVHTASAVFACPPGLAAGERFGEDLGLPRPSGTYS